MLSVIGIDVPTGSASIGADTDTVSMQPNLDPEKLQQRKKKDNNIVNSVSTYNGLRC